MLETIQNIDSSVFLFFNSVHCQFFDTFMSLFSGRFIWIPMYAALLVVMLKRFSPVKVIALVLGIALAIALADQICASLIRPFCQRLRPSNPDNPLSALTHIVNGYRGGAYGFPSCHAANSFALAAFAATMLRQRHFTIFIFSWAVVNSYSRIYLGVHYPGDLIVGALVGLLSGYFCCKLSLRVFSALQSRGIVSDNRRPLLSWRIADGRINSMEIVAFVTIIVIFVVSFVDSFV